VPHVPPTSLSLVLHHLRLRFKMNTLYILNVLSSEAEEPQWAPNAPGPLAYCHPHNSAVTPLSEHPHTVSEIYFNIAFETLSLRTGLLPVLETCPAHPPLPWLDHPNHLKPRAHFMKHLVAQCVENRRNCAAAWRTDRSRIGTLGTISFTTKVMWDTDVTNGRYLDFLCHPTHKAKQSRYTPL
jgi:hypothetical protein